MHNFFQFLPRWIHNHMTAPPLTCYSCSQMLSKEGDFTVEHHEDAMSFKFFPFSFKIMIKIVTANLHSNKSKFWKIKYFLNARFTKITKTLINFFFLLFNFILLMLSVLKLFHKYVYAQFAKSPPLPLPIPEMHRNIENSRNII